MYSVSQKKLFSAERRAKRSKFYKTGVWRRIRSIQLRKHALCEKCQKEKRLTVATDCDHISPEWDTWEEFIAGPFQSLCGPCHKDKTMDEDLPKLLKKEKTTIEVWDV